MLAQEANKTKIEIFNIISENIQKKLWNLVICIINYHNIITL